MTDSLSSATRDPALTLAREFVPKMGAHYSAKRNLDAGPGKRDEVSQLSPFVRRRLITERELAALALDAHGAKKAEKFVQEVVWRTYWKGWLEQRPDVWHDYLAEAADNHDRLARTAALNSEYERAIAGATGIECFDTWAQELIETGYLHNHARMSFASIWIFTLRLPWALGAEFFYHHLLDGDPASNTLSWRWVAGLHTAGKQYLADPAIIERCSYGRFRPAPGELAHNTQEVEPDLPERIAIREPDTIRKSLRTALLVTEDDCTPEHLAGKTIFDAIFMLPTSQLRTPNGAAQKVVEFEAQALKDTAERLEADGQPAPSNLDQAAQLVELCAQQNPQQLVVPMVPQGPALDALRPVFTQLKANGIHIAQLRRDWDSEIWPHATAGFFKVKKKLPQVMQRLGLPS